MLHAPRACGLESNTEETWHQTRLQEPATVPADRPDRRRWFLHSSLSPPVGQTHFRIHVYGRRSGPARQGRGRRWLCATSSPEWRIPLPCPALRRARRWRTFRAAVDGACCASPSNDNQCGTKEWSLVKRFDDPNSGRRHVLLSGSHPCEAQRKMRLDTTVGSTTTIGSPRCSGSTCSTLDLAGRLLSFGYRAGLSLRLGTESRTTWTSAKQAASAGRRGSAGSLSQ